MTNRVIRVLLLTIILMGLFDWYVPRWASFVQPRIMDASVRVIVRVDDLDCVVDIHDDDTLEVIGCNIIE